eukprot:g3899.t1
MRVRKLALCVESWSSIENHFLWNFTRKRLLQVEESHHITDKLYIVHVNTKGKDGTSWEKGTAILGDVQTELAEFDHCIVELEGDHPVNAILQFLLEEDIEIVVVSSKDQNRVKRRMSSNSATQILAKANCSCVFVSPRFSAGDHFRMQAKRQPDALVVNSVQQFRRRVVILLNTGLWDSALVQHSAKNLILTGDLVILVRCVNDNVHRKNATQVQTERDNMRELGWHKFRQNNVSLAVEVVKNSCRNLCEFIDSKGIDLVVMTRSDSHRIKLPMKKESGFHEKCPCPLMTVPTEILKPLIHHNRARNPGHMRNQSSPISPLFSSLTRLRRRRGGGGGEGRCSRKSVFINGSPFRGLGRNRRCQSMDSSETHQEFYSIDYLRSDSVDLTSSGASKMELTNFGNPWNALESTTDNNSPWKGNEELDINQEKVRELRQELSEKEKEIIVLKQCINYLQKHDG